MFVAVAAVQSRAGIIIAGQSLSWVDYPLRTEALAVLLAFLAGVLGSTDGARVR